jgi:arsenate reductase (thioredoxin)
MAEALARKYGSDVLSVASAGLTPSFAGVSLTGQVLKEINVDLGNHRPRYFSDIDLRRFDLIINMSGVEMPAVDGVPVETWDVKDPYGGDEEEFRRARADIEMKVMHLILRVRTGKLTVPGKKFSSRIDSGTPSPRK